MCLEIEEMPLFDAWESHRLEFKDTTSIVLNIRSRLTRKKKKKKRGYCAPVT